MSDRYIKQCSNCGVLYPRADLEIIFTGRRRLVCYKCLKLGYMQTGARSNSHKTKKERAKND